MVGGRKHFRWGCSKRRAEEVLQNTRTSRWSETGDNGGQRWRWHSIIAFEEREALLWWWVQERSMACCIESSWCCRIRSWYFLNPRLLILVLVSLYPKPVELIDGLHCLPHQSSSKSELKIASCFAIFYSAHTWVSFSFCTAYSPEIKFLVILRGSDSFQNFLQKFMPCFLVAVRYPVLKSTVSTIKASPSQAQVPNVCMSR